MKTLIIILTLSLAIPTLAERSDERRQVHQQKRIEQGNQSGQLTRGENKRLERGQVHIDRAQSKAEADGTVTPEEQAKLQHMENKQSRRIYRLKHNDKTEPGTVPAETE